MGNCVVDALYEAYKKKPEIFSKTDIQRGNSMTHFPCGTNNMLSKEKFKERFFHELKDFHKTPVHRFNIISKFKLYIIV